MEMKLTLGNWFHWTSIIMVLIGLFVFAAVYFFGNVNMGATAAVLVLLTVAGPLITIVIWGAMKLDRRDNFGLYRMWRVQTLVYFYMLFMACISFAVSMGDVYTTSSRYEYTNMEELTMVILLVWVVFLAINTVCFLVAARDRNHSSSVRTGDFQKDIANILKDIDDFNGVKSENSEGRGIKFGRKKKEGGADA